MQATLRFSSHLYLLRCLFFFLFPPSIPFLRGPGRIGSPTFYSVHPPPPGRSCGAAPPPPPPPPGPSCAKLLSVIHPPNSHPPLLSASVSPLDFFLFPLSLPRLSDCPVKPPAPSATPNFSVSAPFRPHSPFLRLISLTPPDDQSFSGPPPSHRPRRVFLSCCNTRMIFASRHRGYPDLISFSLRSDFILLLAVPS